MAVHARLSPSGADRWMICSASVQLIQMLIERGELRESDLEGEVAEQTSEEEILAQQFDRYQDVALDPTRESTEFSAEGTVLHDVRANCLALDLDPHNFVGLTLSADGYSFTIDDDMADRLVEGIDWIRERATNPAIERKVNLNEWLPGNYGFCDTYWLDKVRGKSEAYDLYVSDFKNGIGEPVAASNNRRSHLACSFEVIKPDGDIEARRLAVHQFNHRDTGNFDHFQRARGMGTFGENQAINVP